MLENFWINVQYGMNHLIGVNGYSHLLFMVVLAVSYAFKDWKPILILVTTFALGYAISLLLALYAGVNFDGNLIKFLVPLTVLITAIYNVFTAGKKSKGTKIGLWFFISLCFGLIHGLGFARSFKIFAQQSENKFQLLIAFVLGIEIAQIIIVFIVLFIGFLGQTIFRFSRRDWMMVISSIVIGLLIPLIFQSNLLK